MLGASAGRDMFEAFKCSSYIAFHTYIDITFFIIPIQVESTIGFASPVDGDFIVSGEGLDKVMGVLLLEVFNAEVVDAEGKCCELGAVPPQARGEFHRFIAEGRKVRNKLFESNQSCFF